MGLNKDKQFYLVIINNLSCLALIKQQRNGYMYRHYKPMINEEEDKKEKIAIRKRMYGVNKMLEDKEMANKRFEQLRAEWGMKCKNNCGKCKIKHNEYCQIKSMSNTDRERYIRTLKG